MADIFSEKGSCDPKVSIVEMEEGRTRKTKKRFGAFKTLLRRTFLKEENHNSPWPVLVRRGLYLFLAAIILAAIAVM